MVIKIQKDSEFTNLLLVNLMQKHNERRRQGNTEVHVSDILPTSCIRRQYYGRKFPDLAPLSHESVHHFVRGEASEFIITKLADLGVSQAELNVMDGLIAHPDIMDKEVIVELKDTVSIKRLDFSDSTFRSYLRQLLYYLTVTGIEKGILSIRYNIKELRWIKRDEKGDYYLRPFDAKDVGIESWQVILPKDDIARELLKNEIARRKNLFLRALEQNDPAILPRLINDQRQYKCNWCEFYNKCMNEDSETEQAKQMAQEKDLLDISGLVSITDNSH